MDQSARCPYCGAVPGTPGDDESSQTRRALEALHAEIARIREIAERSSSEAKELRLLRETLARLRGTSALAAAQGLTTGREARRLSGTSRRT
jgi:hypothetical protein